MNRLRLSASALVCGAAIGLLLPATANAAPATLAATTMTNTSAESGRSTASTALPDMAVGDQILRQLQDEFSTNMSETKLVENMSGQDIPAGYTVHDLTFRELAVDDESTAAHPWVAIFTFVLLDQDGCDKGGGRTLEIHYDDAQTRTVTIGSAQFAGDAPITLSPAMSFTKAAQVLTDHLKALDPTHSPSLDHAVLRQPASPLSGFTNPLYVFHVTGDSNNHFYAVDTRTSEIYIMDM